MQIQQAFELAGAILVASVAISPIVFIMLYIFSEDQ